MLSDPDGTRLAYNKIAPAHMILSYYLFTLHYGCASVSGTDMTYTVSTHLWIRAHCLGPQDPMMT